MHKPVTIQLGDKERTLKMNLWAACQFEQATGESFFVAVDGFSGKPTAKHLVHLLWCLLVSDDPDLTPEAVARMLPFDRLGEISQKVSQVIVESVGAATGNPPEAQVEVQSSGSTGPNSGRSGDTISA